MLQEEVKDQTKHEVDSVKNSIISSINSIHANEKDTVRDTKISLLFDVIQDVIKKSNEELYDENQTAGLNPQENCISNLVDLVNVVRDLILQQVKAQIDNTYKIIDTQKMKNEYQGLQNELNEILSAFMKKKQCLNEKHNAQNKENDESIKQAMEKVKSQLCPMEPPTENHNKAVEFDQQYKKRQTKFLTRIKTIFQSYDKNMEFDEASQLIEEFPSVKGHNQWPKLSDLKKLNANQLRDHMITQFQFWDLTRANPDGNFAFRISFRFFTQTGEKSPVSGYNQWVNSPEGHNANLNTVDLTQTRKICVVTHKTHNRKFVAWILFYNKSNNISHIANATAFGTQAISNAQANLIDKCPGNGWEVATYEIPDDSKIVAFKYTDIYFDSSYNHLLLDFEPLIIKKDIE